MATLLLLRLPTTLFLLRRSGAAPPAGGAGSISLRSARGVRVCVCVCGVGWGGGPISYLSDRIRRPRRSGAEGTRGRHHTPSHRPFLRAAVRTQVLRFDSVAVREAGRAGPRTVIHDSVDSRFTIQDREVSHTIRVCIHNMHMHTNTRESTSPYYTSRVRGQIRSNRHTFFV